MRLHELAQQQILWGYRWFNAIVERRGRAHLFRIPTVKQKWGYIGRWHRDFYTPEEVERRKETIRRQGPLYGAPRRFENGTKDMQKMCDKKQNAISWIEAYSGELTHHTGPAPRGYCKECWKVYEAIPDAENLRNIKTTNIYGPHEEESLNEWAERNNGWQDYDPEGNFEL
jgi:hypothetical protein